MVCRFGVPEPKMTKDGRSFDHLKSFFVIFGPLFDHLTSFFCHFRFGDKPSNVVFFCHFWFGDQPWFVTEPKMTKNDVRWSNDGPSFVIFGSGTPKRQTIFCHFRFGDTKTTDHLLSFSVRGHQNDRPFWFGDQPSNVVFWSFFVR